MTVCSTISPETVALVKLENNIATYKLRKNIQTINSHDDLNNSDTSLFQYDEVQLELTYTNENQLQEIEDNFEVYYTLATNQMNYKIELTDKEKQIKDLIENYKLIDVNQQTQNQILDTMEVLVSFIESMT